MVLIRLRSCTLDANHDVTEEVKIDMTAKELADLAREKLGCFGQRPVEVYLDTGEKFKGDLYEGQVLYAAHQTLDETNTDAVIKLCLLGPGAVGKSALSISFTNDHFHEEYDPTIEETYRKNVKIDGRKAMLDILDTAGQEDFVALRSVWYQNKDGFILVYAINNPESLNELVRFHQEINSHYEGARVPPILLVANKSDLEDEACRELFSKANEMAKKWNIVEHMKTSAKTTYNVKAAFANIVRATRRKEPESNDGICCTVL